MPYPSALRRRAAFRPPEIPATRRRPSRCAKFVGDARLLCRRDRIAAADDRSGARGGRRGDGLGDRERARANAGISNTPIGPFHTIVRAARSPRLYSCDRLRPDVEPHPAVGRLGNVRRARFRVRREFRPARDRPAAAAGNFAASLPRAACAPDRACPLRPANSRSASPAISETCTPCRRRSAWHRRPSSGSRTTSILSETFAPPSTATNGRSGFEIALPR